MKLQKSHFIEISDIKHSYMINGLLLKAIFFAKNPNQFEKYSDKFIAFLFMEASTRTNLSFKVACQRLGVNILELDIKHSSFEKGETFRDTVETIEAMGADALIVRTSDDQLLNNHRDINSSLINAGSGITSHPSQALLDLFTIQTELNRIDKLTIAIIGDIEHSRVASSNIKLHLELGNEVILCSPEFFNKSYEELEYTDLDDCLKRADVVIFLRIQFERHSNITINKDEYLEKYGLTSNRINQIKDHAVILHPGPVNRGIEISSDVLNHPQVKILDQVKNSIPMRMAIIDSILEEKF